MPTSAPSSAVPGYPDPDTLGDLQLLQQLGSAIPQNPMDPTYSLGLPAGVVAVRGAVGGAVALPGLDCLCNQASGYALDQSGNGNHLRMGAGLATPWANAGYLTTAAGANGFAFLPTSFLTIDLAADSFWFGMAVNMAQPGASTSIAGCADTGSNYGFYLSARTNGSIIPVFNGSGGSWTGATAYNPGVYCDGSDHRLDLWYDAPSRSVFLFRDGLLANVWEGVVKAGSSSINQQPFALGSALGSAGNTAAAVKFKNVKLGVFRSSGLPLNVPEFVSRFAATPTRRVLATDFAAAAKRRVALAWVGQSNEYGTSDYPDTNMGYGRPVRDTVTGAGATSVSAPTTSSMHPRMSNLAGLRGTWLTTLNTALGSTSSTQYWCGMFVAWAASTTYSIGAYAIAGGNIYKLTATSGATPTIATTGSSAPTWPGSGTVVDGEATWTYVRAATAADVVGTVLDSSNALFDPNGMFASIKTNMDALAPGYTKAVAISIGQTDKTVGATQAQYQAALTNAAAWCLAQGYKVLIGFTNNGVTAGLNAWLSGTGKPGRDAALTSFAGNPNVFAGADLFTTLGALAVSTMDVGLLPDQLHMNSMARDKGADAWDAKLAAAGL